MSTSTSVIGINIFSGASTELGAALTNPTELAREKGRVRQRYGIDFAGKSYADVEAAYHLLAGPDPVARDTLMTELIAAKFRQYPELLKQVQACGGVAFLEASSHWTGARTEAAQAWEGQGRESRFIRQLILGFELALQPGLTEQGQSLLF